MSTSALGSVNGKVRHAEAHIDVIHLEERLAELLQHPFEVAHMDVAADHEALDLMEHGRVRLVAVHAVDAAGCDDADRRLLLQHGAHLHRRGVRAQQEPLAVFLRREEEGVVRLAGRVAHREVKPREIVVVGLDIGALGDREAHIGEDHHQLFPDAADGVDAAFGGRVGPDGQGDVHAVRGKLLSEGRGFEHRLAGFERGGDLVFDRVDRGAKAFARFGRHGAQLLHQLGDFALLAERGDADGLKRGEIRSRLHAGKQALGKGIEIVRFIGDGVHGRSQAGNLARGLPLLAGGVKGRLEAEVCPSPWPCTRWRAIQVKNGGLSRMRWMAGSSSATTYGVPGERLLNSSLARGGLVRALLLGDKLQHIGNFVPRFPCCPLILRRDFLGDPQ